MTISALLPGISGEGIGSATITGMNNALSISFDGAYTSLPKVLASSGATYTRNSTKYVLQNGALVALPANTFGTSYDPVTGLYGYLPETAATNLALYSEGSAANWTVSNVVDGTTFFGADNALAFGDNSVQRSAIKAVTLTSGTSYSVAIYVVMDNGLAPVVGTSTITGDFCLNSQATDHAVAALVQDCGNGVYRVSSARTATATGATTAGIYKYTGQSARGFRITRIQIETGTYASSYIKTEAATAARSADVLTVPLANVAGFNSAGYTMFVDGRCDNINATLKTIISAQGATYENSASINDQSNQDVFRIYPNSPTPSVNTVSAYTASARRKLAMSVQVNNCLMSKNGATITADTNTGIPASLTAMYIGRTASSSEFNGYIFSAKLITRPLSQSQINGMTA